MHPLLFIDDTVAAPPSGWTLRIQDNFGAATSGSVHGGSPDILNTLSNTWSVLFGSAEYNASNQLALPSGGGIAGINSESTDHEVEADVKGPNGAYVGLMFRGDGTSGNYLTFAINVGGDWELWSSESGFVLLANGSSGTAADTFYTLKVRTEGNQITCWINGSQVHTASYTNFAGNTHTGFENAFNSATADNFKLRTP